MTMQPKNSLFRRAAGVLALTAVLAPYSVARADISVVASTPELAALTKAVGGSKADVYSVAKPNHDYHTIDPRPSDVARIAKADLVVRSGLGMDMWMDALLNAASNRKLNRGGSGYVNASEGIPLIEVPQGSITGAAGDVHAEGNPHYTYDPVYAKFVARNVARGLIREDEGNAAYYRENLKNFYEAVDARLGSWQKQLAPYAGKPVVTYHRNYNYFLRRFGLRQYGTLEPKPGIPPSASHVAQLMTSMKRDNVKAILVEGIYPRRYPDLVSRQTGAKYEYGPYSVATQNQEGYLKMVDALVDAFQKALS